MRISLTVLVKKFYFHSETLVLDRYALSHSLRLEDLSVNQLPSFEICKRPEDKLWHIHSTS